MTKINFAYVVIRCAAFLCVVVALVSAFAGAHIAGPVLLTAFALFGLGALLNVWLGFAFARVYLGGREIAKHSQPALFRLWLFLNVFLAVCIGVAAIFIIIVRYP